MNKNIYQTWFEKKLPESIKKTIDEMQKINSNYTYHLFDDFDMDKFVKNNFDEEIYNCYTMLNIGAAKADLWRYLILYKNGGVYLDVDSIIHGKLDNILYDDCAVISREKNPNKYVQWCLMFPAKHPILKLCIDKCIQNIKNNTTNDILYLTGPEVYSSAVNEYFFQNVYYKSDEELNIQKEKTKTRLYSFDYFGYASFLHPNKDELYKNKMYWRDEQKTKQLVSLK